MNTTTRILIVAAVAALTAAVLSPSAQAARHCVDFDDLAPGPPITVPFVSRGVNINVLPHHTTLGPCVPPTSFGFARVAPAVAVPGGSPPNSLEVNNVRLEFTMADFLAGNPIKKLKLKYRELGGNVNISVNGACTSVDNFTDIPNGALIGGVKYRRNAARIVLKKKRKGPAIDAFEISGQELHIDDVCAWD